MKNSRGELELDFKMDNARLCAPPITDIGNSSTNLCVVLRRRNKWKGYALLPDEAFYGKDKVPVKPTPNEERQNRKPTEGLSDKPENVRRRELYANDPEYRAKSKARSRRKYRSKSVPRPELDRGKRVNSQTNDQRYWERNKDRINAERRKRYAEDAEYREATLERQRKNWEKERDYTNRS